MFHDVNSIADKLDVMNRVALISTDSVDRGVVLFLTTSIDVMCKVHTGYGASSVLLFP